MQHDLKIWPFSFAAILDGRKRFEIRKNDRDFKQGDTLHLHEFVPRTRKYTGRHITASVTYLLNADDAVDFGLLETHVIMSIDVLGSTVTDDKHQAHTEGSG